MQSMWPVLSGKLQGRQLSLLKVSSRAWLRTEDMLSCTAMGYIPHTGQNCYRRTRDTTSLIPIPQCRVGSALMYSGGNCHHTYTGWRATCMQDLWGKKRKRTPVLQGPLVPYQPRQGKMQRSPSRLELETIHNWDRRKRNKQTKPLRSEI